MLLGFQALFADRLLRAGADARAAIDAQVFIDDADIVDLKRLLRAFVYADAACDALVGVDFHSHM